MSNNWCNTESWDNNALVYNKKANVLYFDSTAEYETAVYTVSVPEWTNSFSLSFKAGNSHSAAKVGAKDAGYITVGTDDGIIARTPMIEDNLTFVNYTLHNVPIQSEQLYITSEAYNSYGDSIDFYFGELNIEFYDTIPDGFITEYYFSAEPTTEKVQNTDGAPVFLPIIAIALFTLISSFCALHARKEKKNENS